MSCVSVTLTRTDLGSRCGQKSFSGWNLGRRSGRKRVFRTIHRGGAVEKVFRGRTLGADALCNSYRDEPRAKVSPENSCKAEPRAKVRPGNSCKVGPQAKVCH